jgi:hypothetical protein
VFKGVYKDYYMSFLAGHRKEHLKCLSRTSAQTLKKAVSDKVYYLAGRLPLGTHTTEKPPHFDLPLLNPDKRQPRIPRPRKEHWQE